MKRRAVIIEAGLFEHPEIAIRKVGPLEFPHEFPHEKGGWITLDWEQDGAWAHRTITVSTMRALQAIADLTLGIAGHR